MEKIRPHNNYVLCVDDQDIAPNVGGIQTPSTYGVKTYRIIDVGKNPACLRFKAGDRIVVNATGTKIVNENKTFYLMDVATIISVVED